ncbi:MAG: DUF4252 domain-containing protein [Prevotella sp.]|nr:DUF4252 domain-containing protein [Prevotella sp.]MBR1527206.1 DUF4252 domain-containing protein [Prevotella sp.]
MKKFLLTLAVLAASIAGFAQSANDIVNEMKSEQGVEVQVMTKMMLQMQFAQIPDENVKELGKKMSGMTVMMYGKASDEVKNKFAEKVEALNTNGYETVEEKEEMGIKVKSLIKKDGELITEVVNIIDAQGEKLFTIINGKFTMADFEQLKNSGM